jgi:hypothetical protein
VSICTKRCRSISLTICRIRFGIGEVEKAKVVIYGISESIFSNIRNAYSEILEHASNNNYL